MPFSIAMAPGTRLNLWVTNTSFQSQLIPRDSRVASINFNDDVIVATLTDDLSHLVQSIPPSSGTQYLIGRMIDPQLSDDCRRELLELLEEYGEVFDIGNRPVGRTSTVHHCIDAGESASVKSRPYRISSAE